MISRWRDHEAKAVSDDLLQLRIYTSRLLGSEPDLVLHGGGNTSVKLEVETIFGDSEEILYIKGSGRNLATIDSSGFAPVKLSVLKRVVTLDRLADADLVRVQRSAMIEPHAPDPSIEAVVHAIIPFRFVDHTHADAVVTITNTGQGKERIRELYGNRVLVIPYVHPGFDLAKEIYRKTRGIDWHRVDGLIILNHGLFTFADNAGDSYNRMIGLVSGAEHYLIDAGCSSISKNRTFKEDLHALCRIRHQVSQARGSAMLARLEQSPEACAFAALDDVETMAVRSPLTADHIIRTRPTPVIIGNDPLQDITDYASKYRDYIARNDDSLTDCPDPAPRWAVWPGYGIIAFGKTMGKAGIVLDIASHTIRAIQCGQTLGGWTGLTEKQIFEMEYWPLQQAKLREQNVRPELQGKIALVTGAASGIGRACAEMLHRQGAAVAGLDLAPEIERCFNTEDLMGIRCDVTDEEALKRAVETIVRRFGGLDILIPNAGVFPASRTIEEMDDAIWHQSMEVNLSSNQRLLKRCIPYLKMGIEAAVVFIASKNVPAPGPGASAYSVAKAGLTQLARVAAMELGPDGIRVNVVHPNAVYDTAIWTPEVLESRACHYDCTVEEYKTKNCLKTEVRSRDVAALVCAMVGPAFSKTTGAQVPIDGGNERVI